uniref:Bicarbonate transporter-like transmembrane domain-containing protein n=1 Tax=Mastacembelus armatus TaxID=205130 RepID=A0A3Q3N071_9TELE
MNHREEVRAHRDLDSFMSQTSILLDEKVATLDEDGQESCDMDEVMNSLVTDAGGKEFNVHRLSETIQGVTPTSTGIHYQQSWLLNSCGARYAILILGPSRTVRKLGRTFATMFSNISFRQKLLLTKTQEEFKQMLVHQRQQLCIVNEKLLVEGMEDSAPHRAGKGVCEDLCHRLLFYLSDFIDGLTGKDCCLLKYTTTAVFLYIAILLLAIAFGSLNDESTRGEIDDCCHSVGGVIYALFAGSPLVIPLTTAPLAIFINVIRGICDDYDLDFDAFYACIGLWNSFFLILGGLFNLKEFIALFISIIFQGCCKRHHQKPRLTTTNSTLVLQQINTILEKTKNQIAEVLRHRNDTVPMSGHAEEHVSVFLFESLVLCTRERPILCLLLMLGTLWLGYTHYLIKRSPYLNNRIREVVSDSALPISLVKFSFIGSYLFFDIQLPVFSLHDSPVFNFPPFEKLTGLNTLSTTGLGFLLALLIFLDQNIVISLHIYQNTSKTQMLLKGTAFHWDLMLTGFINILMSCLGLPWMHATFPHSSLHARQLAKVEQHIENGHLYTTISSVKETSLTSLAANILIAHPLRPLPLHCATSLDGNQMVDRMALLLKEQIHHVPQRKVHYFTGLQMIQLIVLCTFGMHPLPYMRMVFPLLMILLVPVYDFVFYLRNNLLRRVIDIKYT